MACGALGPIALLRRRRAQAARSAKVANASMIHRFRRDRRMAAMPPRTGLNEGAGTAGLMVFVAIARGGVGGPGRPATDGAGTAGAASLGSTSPLAAACRGGRERSTRVGVSGWAALSQATDDAS